MSSSPKNDRRKATWRTFGIALGVVATLVLLGVLWGMVGRRVDSSRVHLRDDFRDSLSEVVRLTDDAKARALLSFFDSEHRLIEPTSSLVLAGSKIEPIAPDQRSFQFVTLLPRDATLSGQIAEVFGLPASAMFMARSRILVDIRRQSQSSVWQGITGLHELLHASDHQMTVPSAGDHNTVVTDPKYLKARFYQEREAYLFQSRLALRLGGTAYREILDQRKTEISEELRRRGETVATFIVAMGEYLAELDAIDSWGPASSEDERGSRMIQLQIQAYFELLEEHFGGTTSACVNRQALILKNLTTALGGL